MRRNYETTPGRVVLGLLIGCGVAGLLTVFAHLAFGLTDTVDWQWRWPEAPRAQRLDRQIWLGVIFFAIVIGLTSVPYYVGALTLGAPGWWLLHRAGYRGPMTALLFGAVLSFLGMTALVSYHHVLPSSDAHTFHSDAHGVLISANRLTPYGWTAVLTNAAAVGAIGGVAGLVIWRLAYRRAKSSDRGAAAARAQRP